MVQMWMVPVPLRGIGTARQQTPRMNLVLQSWLHKDVGATIVDVADRMIANGPTSGQLQIHTKRPAMMVSDGGDEDLISEDGDLVGLYE